MSPVVVPAAFPENEDERLAALHQYDFIDALPEQDFDDLTKIVTQICDTPIAFITLIERDYQWVKSKIGLDLTEIARETSFCPHAILNPHQVMVVPDALADERFKRNPAVIGEPGVRFYAGAPLVTPDGYPIGTLCTFDYQARDLSVQQLDALQALSRQTIGQMGLRLGHRQLKAEQAKSERLLLNILPPAIAEQLKNEPKLIAKKHETVTILFADLVNFTQFSSQVSPQNVVTLLNEVFSCFDRLTDRFGLEKIKTIGDAYMAVAGLPDPVPNAAERAANLALAMLAETQVLNIGQAYPLNLRIGLHSGAAIAGVIGEKKFGYDIWGDAVNTASRMESSGIPGKIQVSPAVWTQLRDRFRFAERGVIDIKGKGQMKTYFLLDHLASLA